jgi:hypothetical protein
MRKNNLSDGFFHDFLAWLGIVDDQKTALSDAIYRHIAKRAQVNSTDSVRSIIQAYHAGLNENRFVEFVEGTRTPEQAKNHQAVIDFVHQSADILELRTTSDSNADFRLRNNYVRAILFSLYDAAIKKQIPLYYYSPRQHVEKCKQLKEEYRNEQRSIANRVFGRNVTVTPNDSSAHEILCEDKPKSYGESLSDILQIVLLIAVVGVGGYFLVKFYQK